MDKLELESIGAFMILGGIGTMIVDGIASRDLQLVGIIVVIVGCLLVVVGALKEIHNNG